MNMYLVDSEVSNCNLEDKKIVLIKKLSLNLKSY